MKSIPVLAAMAEQDVRRQELVAENFDRLWRDKYPHVVSTLGTRNIRPETVERQLGLRLARMPMPSHGFSLWYFRTAADLQQFVRALPTLLVPA